MKLPINSIKMKMDYANIIEVQCIKYLGVIQISYVKSKISKGIGIMYIARNYINKNALLGLYIIRIYSLTLYIAFNLGETHQIVTLILYLCYRNVFLESLHFLIMMFHLNCYLGKIILRPYVS